MGRGQSTIKDLILKLMRRRERIADEEWRKYVPNMLEATGNLKAEGYIQIEQNGIAVDVDQVSGLRLKSMRNE